MRDEPDGPITMERVAAVLGTRPMSLYTHVRNRDELVALAAQQALREWDASVPKGARWDNQLRAWCRSLREHVQAYPPLMLEMTSQGTFQPALLEAVAVLARILRKAGLEGEALAAALRWVPQTVLGAIILELSRPEGLETPDHEAAAIYGSLASLDADRPGAVRRRAAALRQPGSRRPVRLLDRPPGRRGAGGGSSDLNARGTGTTKGDTR